MHNDKCQHQLGVGDATKFGFNQILIIIIINMARITDINTENILLSLLTTNQCYHLSNMQHLFLLFFVT